MRNLRIAFIGNFEAPFSTENDRKWSLEKLGHTVISFQENKTKTSELFDVIKDIDMVMYSHTHGWSICDLDVFFKGCSEKNIPTVSVHLDRWAWLEREKDMGKEETWLTEWQFMADGSPEAVELYKKYGLNWRWLKPGVIERDCYLAQPDHVRFPHEIIFVGSKGYHPEYKDRPRLIEFLHRTYGKRFGHYGGDSTYGTIRGHDLNVLYASAKVVVGDSCFGGRPRYWSDRVTETIGRGGFLLHPKCEGLEIPGMGEYEPGNFAQLKEMIDKYIQNDHERIAQRDKAHHWVKTHDTYTQRSQEMLNEIFKES